MLKFPLVFGAAGLIAVYFLFIRRRKLNRYTFVPWPEASLRDCKEIIAVDCTHDIIPHLTHHRTNFDASLESIRGDTSTDIVLNAIQSKHPAVVRASWVTVNHFDVDAFTSVWALLNHEKSLFYGSELRECAHIGDFRELGIPFPTNGCVTAADSACFRLDSSWCGQRAETLLLAQLNREEKICATFREQR